LTPAPELNMDKPRCLGKEKSPKNKTLKEGPFKIKIGTKLSSKICTYYNLSIKKEILKKRVACGIRTRDH